MNKIKELIKYSETLNVLYVEDDENMREDTSEILEDYFDTLDTTINGQEALDKYNKYYQTYGEYYDLIITDINMPIMDGEVLIKEIESINDQQSIIVISAYNESSRLMRLIQKGITSFVLKPIDSTQFVGILYKTCKNIFAQKNLKLYHEMLYNKNKNLDLKVKELSQEVIATQRLSIETIGNMVESYDEETGNHVKRIEAYTHLIIDQLDIDTKNQLEDKDIIPFAYLLHDIGKLIIPKHVLQKPGALQKDELIH